MDTPTSTQEPGLNVFMTGEDKEKSEQIIAQVMPLLKGATMNQIKMALDKCYTLAQSCFIVN